MVFPGVNRLNLHEEFGSNNHCASRGSTVCTQKSEINMNRGSPYEIPGGYLSHRIHVLSESIDVHLSSAAINVSLGSHEAQKLRVALAPHRLADEIGTLVEAVGGCRRRLITSTHSKFQVYRDCYLGPWDPADYATLDIPDGYVWEMCTVRSKFRHVMMVLCRHPEEHFLRMSPMSGS